VHINTLLIGAFSPMEDRDFLYSPGDEFHGEAAILLDALKISTVGRAAEAVHAEFQRGGYFLTHVLECPQGTGGESGAKTGELLAMRLDSVGRRIRRSLKPRRAVLISQGLAPVVEKILALELGCPVVSDDGKLFELDGPRQDEAVVRFRERLAGTAGD
jgi:hypothetical protein